MRCFRYSPERTQGPSRARKISSRFFNSPRRGGCCPGEPDGANPLCNNAQHRPSDRSIGRMTLHQYAPVLGAAPQFAPREVEIEKRSDGTLVLRSRIVLETPHWSILDFIPEWAETAPHRVFLAQRGR